MHCYVEDLLKANIFKSGPRSTPWKCGYTPIYIYIHKTKSDSSKKNLISCYPRLSFNLIYNLVSLATCINIFMGLILVHFQTYWLLRFWMIPNLEVPYPINQHEAWKCEALYAGFVFLKATFDEGKTAKLTLIPNLSWWSK